MASDLCRGLGSEPPHWIARGKKNKLMEKYIFFLFFFLLISGYKSSQNTGLGIPCLKYKIYVNIKLSMSMPGSGGGAHL